MMSRRLPALDDDSGPVPAERAARADAPCLEPRASADHRVTYISWAESCSRSDYTARELGGRSHMVYLPVFGSRPSTILFKYAGQWFRTARILRRERPDTVFVMTPPLVAALPAFWYAWRYGRQVVLDAHTAAFLHPRWRRFQWLQRILCRTAVTTLVHNERIAELVRAAGAPATLVTDVPVVFAEREPFARPPGFVVAVACSFSDDEPLATIFEAAQLTPDVHFFVTGDSRRLSPSLARHLPANVRLTGLLSTAAYGGLVASADVVLALTTRDKTMLRSAYEAIYQGTPVIVSDWPVLREAFREGAIHVDNTPAGIAAAVRRMASNHADYVAGAARLREEKARRWLLVRQEIISRIDSRGSTWEKRVTSERAAPDRRS
jgi:glycosyltransferase involved in cell wall biosynthesis